MPRLSPIYAGLLALAAQAQAGEFHRWIQYVPGGVEARAITDAAACPKATIDGLEKPMSVRAERGENYPVTVCALPVPAGAKAATIAGYPLPLPKPHPNRILVMGDTGCRLKGAQVQACNDMAEWPFRLGVDIATDFKPDLVLHVGDFHYRESACPIDNRGCAGTPFGDTWDVWKLDFFEPGEPLLDAAPWIFVRGNHEECDRGGKGWARTLDAYAFKPGEGASGCLGPANPYTVDIGGLTIQVMDVSTADERANPAQVAWYRPQFEAAGKIAGPVWLTFHRPAWAVDDPTGKVRGDNGTLQEASRTSTPANVMAVLSGHHHTFSAASFEQDMPIQIVSGHGGDDLSPHAPKDVVGLNIAGATVKAGIGRPGVYGFSILERAADDNSGLRWNLTAYDAHGRALGKCMMDGRNLACE